MLSAGLSSLAYLKSRILPASSATDTTWDLALCRLGLAMTTRMETHCNRSFDRAVGAINQFSAWTQAVTLRRYPVETISTVQILDPSAGLTDYAGEYALDASAGVLSFTYMITPGTQRQRLVITYTGGYWLDPLTTPATAMPTGATPLPEDILEVWLAEVQLQAEARSMFEAVGLRVSKDAAKAVKLIGLSEDAIAALAPYRRFSGE